MGKQIVVQATLTFEVDNEMDLMDAGFRAWRQQYGAVFDEAGDVSDDMRQIAQAAAESPETALLTLLSGTSGPLHALDVPGVHVVGHSLGTVQE